MSVDLKTNKDIILKAYYDVVDDKTDTDWALFGYEGPTNSIKVIGTGDGGLEEMAEDLNSNKIMYGVIRVRDPKTTRTKLVLINWQGEGAPNVRKGTCARHLMDVQNLLRGVHLTFNARNEEEVETEAILEAVGKASATSYDFADRSEISDEHAPVKNLVRESKKINGDGIPNPSIKPFLKLDVGTNYKRTNPLSEINTNRRNKFWEEQEEEEKRRKDEEHKQKEEELKQLEKERREREIKEAQQREKLSKERNARIMAERKAEAAVTIVNEERVKNETAWQKELEEHQREEHLRSFRAEDLRMQRKMEAENLIGMRKLSDKKSVFEISGNYSPEEKQKPPSKILKEFRPVQQEICVENQKDIPHTEAEKKSDHVPDILEKSSSTGIPLSSVTVTHYDVKPEIVRKQNTYENKVENLAETIIAAKENLKIEDSPTLNGNHVYCNSDAADTEKSNLGKQHLLSTPNASLIFEVNGVEYQILPEHGLCATALYDYQAADDTEITFDPGEIITNIDQIDPGWWQGIGPDGKFGLFPANYVELINAQMPS